MSDFFFSSIQSQCVPLLQIYFYFTWVLVYRRVFTLWFSESNMANDLTTTSLYTALKLISPQKKKILKWNICFYKKVDTAWDSKDACGQGWTLNKITFASCRRHTCRMGCVSVGDGPVTGRPQQSPHRRGVIAAINLSSLCIPDRPHVKLHSGAQQEFLQVSKMLKNKDYEG